MNVTIRDYRDLLAAYVRPQWRKVLLLAGLLFGWIGLQLVNPQIIRYFIDTAQSRGAQDTLLAAAGLYIGIALTVQAAALAAGYVAEDVGWTATNALRTRLALHCLRLDLSFHKLHTPGELIERIDGDTTMLSNFFAQFVIKVLGNGALVLGILVLLAGEDPRVGFGLVLYTLATVLALAALQRPVVARWEAERQAQAEFYGFVEERISGTEDIRSAGAEPYVLSRLFGLLRTTLGRNRTARLLGNTGYAVTNFLYVLGYAVGLGLGAYLYTRGEVTIGTAYLIVYYIGMLAQPLQRIREQVEDLQGAGAGIARIQELFNTSSRLPPPRAPRTLTGAALGVAFEGVSFAYADGAAQPDEAPGPVLRDVSFEVEPGRVLGLLGRTGSGKTTLARLLFRLYDPTAGAVRVGGVDLCDLSPGELRGHVGMVTQDVQLFQATVRENLTFFDESVSAARMEQVLRDLRLWDWAQSLPQGLDTPLAAGGQGLSAGEAQLLAFTRVFLKDPGLVLLDEASSRLDPATEALLERAVDRLLAGRTGIVIAHRLRTVLRADDILMLEDGRVVEFGPRAALAADPGSRFYRLLQTGLEEALV